MNDNMRTAVRAFLYRLAKWMLTQPEDVKRSAALFLIDELHALEDALVEGAPEEESDE